VRLLTILFPVWVLAFCVAALIVPEAFTWFRGPWIRYGLAVIMLGMGLTLTPDDFRRVLKMPKPVMMGVGAQFLIMPLVGYGVALLLGLPTAFAVGLILVACCPGGTASNIVVHIARSNLALSVLMTMVSTMAAMVFTPQLTYLLADHLVAVDRWKMFLDIVVIVVVPVLVGVGLNGLLPRLVKRVESVCPLVAVITVALICASIVGSRREDILEHFGWLLLAVFLLHFFGFLFGYGFARLLRFDPEIARTASIEVGMQNSGLGAELARSNFADPLTAVPSALSAVMHSVVGSIIAAYWRIRPAKS